jgi:hypothetical protein
MSLISMIPLEGNANIERAVLTQFGDHLDDAALRTAEPSIQRLHLSSRTDGLDECTRDVQSAMLVQRQGQ